MIICRSCDRGHRYCGLECSQRNRQRNRKVSARHYRQTPRGRRNNAARQQRYRERHHCRDDKKVTHHSSTARADVVCSKARRVATAVRSVFNDVKGALYCSHCGSAVDSLLRRDYLQQTQRTQSQRDAFSFKGAP